MSDFFGSLRRRKGNEPSETTSPGLSLERSSRNSTDAFNEESMPEDGDKIDELFEQVLIRRDLDEEKRKPLLEGLGYQAKWEMIVQDHRAEKSNFDKKYFSEEEEAPQHLIYTLYGLAGEMWTATKGSTARRVERHTANRTHLAPVGRRVSEAIQSTLPPIEESAFTDRNSPEYYIKKFMATDLQTVTPALADNLAISLRTRSLDWVIKFTDLKGLKVITTGLSYLNRKPDSERNGEALELEYGLIKCVKVMVNAKWGAREAIMNPEYIHSFVFSIICPQWQARKIICDILLFLCHCDVPLGHSIVMQGFELLRQHRRDFSIFDSWIKDFEHTLDGTGRVGGPISTESFHKVNVYVPPDNHLIEYCLSNLSLINSAVYIPNEVRDRIYLRNQLKASGLDRVLRKLDRLNDPTINDQLEKYRERQENDFDEEFGDEISMYDEISQPNELLEMVLDSIADSSQALTYLLQIFRNMLLIKGDSGEKAKYYHAISEVVSNIVMDRRQSATAEELGSVAFGVSVHSMVSKFNELDRLQELASSAEENQEKALRLESENKDLREQIELLQKSSGLEYQKQQRSYKLENIALRALQQKSNKTIAQLQEKLREKTVIFDSNANISAEPPVNVSDQLKFSAKRCNNMPFQFPNVDNYRQQPNQNSQLHQYQQNQNTSYSPIGAGGFIIPGSLAPMTPVPYNQGFNNYSAHYLGPSFPEDRNNPAESKISENYKNLTPTALYNPSLKDNGNYRRPPPPINIATKPSSTTQHLPATLQEEEADIKAPEESINSESLSSPLTSLPKVSSPSVTSVPLETLTSTSPIPSTPISTTVFPLSSSLPPGDLVSHNTNPSIEPSTSPPSPSIPVSTIISAPLVETDTSPPSPSIPVSATASTPPTETNTSSRPSSPIASVSTTLTPSPNTPPSVDLTPSISDPSTELIASPQPPPAPPGQDILPPPPPAPLTQNGLPPPPPPPGQGGLPPPPPPPGFNGPSAPAFPMGPLRKMLRHYPQMKLKNLQWQKIEFRSIGSTIWKLEGVDENEIEDDLDKTGVFKKIDDLFPAKVNLFFENKLKLKLEKKKDAIKFLTHDKSRNIDIAIISKLKMYPNFAEVRRDIMKFNEQLCIEIFLSNLKDLKPDARDNTTLMLKYQNDPNEAWDELDIAEQFTLEMYKMYRYEKRIEFMLSRVQFKEKFENLEKDMTMVYNVSEALKNSKSLKNVLCLILVVGNYMNAQSLQGGAFGMRISSINKLVDTKASNVSSINLLHVVAGATRRQFPKLLQFLEDLKDIEQAARIVAGLNEMIQQYADIEKGLKILDKELNESWKPGEGNFDETEDYFPAVMKKYQEEANNRFEDLKTLYVNMDAACNDVMSYYGEEPTVARPDDFFSTFARFVSAWKNADAAEIKIQQRQEREERRKRAEEEKKEKTKLKQDALQDKRNPVQDISASFDDKGESDRCMMDNILEKLRHSDFEVKTTRRLSKKNKETGDDNSSISAAALLESLASDK